MRIVGTFLDKLIVKDAHYVQQCEVSISVLFCLTTNLRG